MAAPQLDLPQLSSYCSLPQGSINTLLDAPTADLVRSLLESITVKAQEHNDLASEKLKVTVELENAVRRGDSKAKLLKSTVDKGLKEAAELRQKLNAEGECDQFSAYHTSDLRVTETSRVSVESELESLKASTSSSTSESFTLKTRIASLEASNRDSLSLLESKTTAYDKLAEELNYQHQKTIELRREVSDLEQSIQSAESASSSAKFHEQGLHQEIEHLKRNNDWLDTELKTKSIEYTKYRKEKSQRIAELQRQNDESSSTIGSLNRTEITLRRRLDEVSEKVDDTFQKIQQMQEEAAKKEESFQLEITSANRLVELKTNSANTERQRQQDLSSQLEAAKDEASDQIGRLSAELETEHTEREAAEGRTAELEVQIERLQATITMLRDQEKVACPPHRGINGFVLGSPSRGDSTPRAFSPSSSQTKGGLSLTQVYSDYNDLKSELEAEKRRNEKLSSTIDEMIQEMETRQPEIEELRADHSRLESEVTDISALIDIIGKERDQAVKGTRKWEGQVEAKIQEGEVLRQQLRDLSSQVKVLLMEAHLREQGHDDLGSEGRMQLERLAWGDVDGDAAEGETDTSRYISENLVNFRSIADLQEQNTKLIKVTREVGERMEHEEALKKQAEAARDWEDLQQKYERCVDELKSTVTQSQSYVRERDMFRRMLVHRGQLPPGTELQSLFGESVNGDVPPSTSALNGVMKSIEDPSSRDEVDYAKLLKDMQAHLDAYKHEAATDHSTLKDQVDKFSRTNGELRSEVVKSSSQVTLGQARYEMLQGNYVMLKNQHAELQKRSQVLSENAAKHELRAQQVAEELVEKGGLAESMRNENANLKAEKEFWRTVEKRLTEDNESLVNERGRLNTLNANLQNLLNERDHSDSEARRRLQNRVDALETELRNTKSKLLEETEENKRSVSRREYDHAQSQKRVDDLVSSLGTVREELVAAKTTRDHLLTRVDELTIELRSAEERVNVLQSTPTIRVPANDGSDLQHTAVNDEGSSLTKEQELSVQLSELKRDLDLAKAELENVKGQVEQYKAISQSSEEELASLNETQDLYRQDTDKLVEEKDVKMKQLEQRVEDTNAELVSTQSELSNLRNEQSENGLRLIDQKKAHEAELEQLKDEDSRHAAAAQYYQEDLKVQAEIAQQAQQNYENELVKHADAAKALQKVRGDYNDLKLVIVEVKAEAESARISLSQNEESWTESRERYENEMAELNAGRDNLKSQNNHLHQQLESVTNQITTLQKRPESGDEPQLEGSLASGLENLQEVIKYLRREKEIVDVQLELSSQEAKRVKQQLDYTQSQLDDTRLKLNQHRRTEANSERSALDHNKLMETLNELTINRESNVTLRAESRQAQAALATRSQELEELGGTVEPLQAEILQLKSERESQDGETKLLKEDRDRWQQRTQNVLQKYDRVDPAELEALKEQLKVLEAERKELTAAKQTLQEQVDSVSAQITRVQDQSNDRVETMKGRLTDQFKARSKTLSDRIKERDTALQTATIEKQGLEQQLAGLSELSKELEAMKAERDAAVGKADTADSKGDSTMDNGADEGQIDESEASNSPQTDLNALQSRLKAAEAKALSEESEAAGLRDELAASKSRIAELEAQITQMQQSIDASNAELAQLRQMQQENTAEIPPDSEAEAQMDHVRKDFAQAQREVEKLRTNAAVNTSLTNVSPEDGSKSVQEQVAELAGEMRKKLDSQHDERIKQLEENFQKRTKAMQNQLTQKLLDGKSAIRQSLQKEHEQAFQTLKTSHEKEIEDITTRHKDETDELQQGEESEIAESKAAWDQEQNVQTTNGESDMKRETQNPPSNWQPSEEEVKALLNSNFTAKEVLKRNIINHIKRAKEELTAHLKEEHEKLTSERISELQTKANTAKEHAVALEGKKTSVQVNMANNKLKIAQFRLDVVQRAVQETPQKAVQEVWVSAKDAKPPPTVQQPQQQASKSQTTTSTASGQLQQQASKSHTPTQTTFGQQQTPKPQAPTATTFGQPTPTDQATQAGSPKPQPNPFPANRQLQQSGISTFGHPTPLTQGPPQIQPQAKDQPQSGISPLGRPNDARQSSPPHSPRPHQNQGPTQGQFQGQGQGPNLASAGPLSNPGNHQQRPPQLGNPFQSNLPQKPFQGQGNHLNAGTGPSALRGLQQSSLPIARGGSMRGNQISRGRGSNVGRGGPQAIDTSRGQGQQQGRGSPQGTGSPTSGLNAGAKQFIPGNKRPRDDGPDGPQRGGSNGKRIRGGHGGAF